MQLIGKGHFELVTCVDQCPIRFVIIKNDKFQVLYNKRHRCLYKCDEQLKDGIIEDHWRKSYCLKTQIGGNK